MSISMTTSVLRIHCFRCQKEYLLNSEDISSAKIHSCPHCAAQITQSQWDDMIRAINMVNEANGNLTSYNENTNKSEPVFSISIESVPTCI